MERVLDSYIKYYKRNTFDRYGISEYSYQIIIYLHNHQEPGQTIYAMVQTGDAQPWSYLGSLALIMSIPVVVIFLLLQHSLLNRMMFGAIND